MGPRGHEWVEAATFASRGEAEVARTALEATGIDAVIHADDAGHAGALPLSLRGVEVRVPQERWREAREALGLRLTEETHRRIPPWVIWTIVAAVVLVSLAVALDVAG